MVILKAKQIAEMNMENFCQRCFWFKHRFPMSVNNPFHTQMPGVFSTLDTYTKQVITTIFSSTNELPNWLKKYFRDNIVRVIHPNYSDYQETSYRDRNNNVIFKLIGVPDSIWEFEDNSFAIVDYKVTSYTRTQERLLPMYEAQLNAYSYLWESKNYKVKKLALIYLHPQKYEEYADFVIRLNERRLTLYFKCIVKPVEKWQTRRFIDIALKATRILKSTNPPQGRDNCYQCKELNKWLESILQVL